MKLEHQHQLCSDHQKIGLMRLILHLRTFFLLHLFPESDNNRMYEQTSTELNKQIPC